MAFRPVHLSIAHPHRQHFGILNLFRSTLVGSRLLFDRRAEPSLIFCETLAQLFFSTRFFKPLFLSQPTVVFRVSSLELSLSWGLDSSASLESLVLFDVTIKSDRAQIDKAGVGDWVYIRLGKLWSTFAREEKWRRF